MDGKSIDDRKKFTLNSFQSLNFSVIFCAYIELQFLQHWLKKRRNLFTLKRSFKRSEILCHHDSLQMLTKGEKAIGTSKNKLFIFKQQCCKIYYQFQQPLFQFHSVSLNLNLFDLKDFFYIYLLYTNTFLEYFFK